VRKRIAVSAQTGLHVECLILIPAALAYAAALAAHHQGVFGAALGPSLILMVCGPATVVPLAAFAVAARRLPLTVVRFLQFLSPSLQFCVGLINGEQLTPLRFVSFLFIWAGVMIFASGAYGGRTNFWSLVRGRKKGVFFF
jgi:chloramphenicol-sensitive protein RarD